METYFVSRKQELVRDGLTDLTGVAQSAQEVDKGLLLKWFERPVHAVLFCFTWVSCNMLSTGGDLSSITRQLCGTAYSFWLFTRSDLKTIILPSFCFATSTEYSIQNPSAAAPLATFTPGRLTLSFFWVWINLLPFEIENQRRPQAIQEDTINKPWRTMPSKRMTADQARTAVLVLYPVAIAYSFCVGGWRQCLALVALGTWYNEFQGADRHPLERNLMNAGGYLSLGSGALQVLVGWRENIVLIIWPWMLLIACIVLTTVQFQDIPDQAGDQARGRRTLLLMIGDVPTRRISALVMIGWVVYVPWFWQLTLTRGLYFRVLGLLAACRTLMLNTPSGDKNTFRLWNCWMVCLYVLPALAHAPWN